MAYTLSIPSTKPISHTTSYSGGGVLQLVADLFSGTRLLNRVVDGP